VSRKQPHTACTPGQRVQVTLRNGDSFVAKFKERKNSKVYFDDRMVRRGDIATFTVVKGWAGA
jgi:hypothetical protein